MRLLTSHDAEITTRVRRLRLLDHTAAHAAPSRITRVRDKKRSKKR